MRMLTMKIDMYRIWTFPERRCSRIGMIAPCLEDVPILGLDADILDTCTPTKVTGPWGCVLLRKSSYILHGKFNRGLQRGCKYIEYSCQKYAM